MRVVSPREIAEIERATIDIEKIPGLTLMERAGERAAAVAIEMLSDELEPGAVEPGRVAVWCGKGNNGGDGLVVARLLAEAGVKVEVYLLASTGELSTEAAENHRRLSGLDVLVIEVDGESRVEEFRGEDGRYDLIVDAILGTGFSGRPRGLYEDAILAINDAGCRVLAIDIPSGVSGDTGAVPKTAVRADRTVTFGLVKLGLVQYPGAGLAGEIEVADIGFPPHLLDGVPSSRIFLTTEEEADSLLPVREPDAHKRSCGSVLVVGGSPGLSGAPAMCAQAALRSAAGLVTLLIPEGLHQIMETKLTEVMTRPLPQTKTGALSLKAADEIVGICDRYDVLALGPGMSTDPHTVELVRLLVSEVEIPMVLDADGLNALVGQTGLLRSRKWPLVLTPHPGEMARLIEKETSDVQGDRVGVASEFAAQWGVVVVLKGAGTVIARPDGTVHINATGNPGMASAGMGDVLTGCVASLIAQGVDEFDAAVAGVYYHGVAADLVANMDGMMGMLAGDVVRHLPLAMRRRE